MMTTMYVALDVTPESPVMYFEYNPSVYYCITVIYSIYV